MDGSILKTFDYLNNNGFVNLWPKPTLLAFQIIAVYAVFEATLQLLLPGQTVYGPISPTGHRPVYKVSFSLSLSLSFSLSLKSVYTCMQSNHTIFIGVFNTGRDNSSWSCTVFDVKMFRDKLGGKTRLKLIFLSSLWGKTRQKPKFLFITKPQHNFYFQFSHVI